MRGLDKMAAAGLCGAVGAGLYLTVLVGSPGAVILVYLTQLPLFFAGLWLGIGGALVAGGVATIVLAAVGGLIAAALFAALNAIPVVVLVRQALLARPGREGVTEWYPAGALAGWLTALALAGLVAALVALGGPERMEQGLRTVIAGMLSRIGGEAAAAPGPLAAALALVMPGVIAASWMVMVVVNALLAQGLLTRFALNWRPAPDLAALDLPRWLVLVFGLAVAAALWDGGVRMCGINVLIALIVPFGLAGLAVLHTGARRLAHPLAVLVAFYVMAALFGWPLLMIAVVGLFEPWLGLRRRLAPPGNF